MKKQIVKFVVDKNLDIENHLIGLNTYKDKTHSGTYSKNEKFDKLLKLSRKKQYASFAKEVKQYYSPEKQRFLRVISQELNSEWVKIEKKFFAKLELIHKYPFPYPAMKGVISSAGRFGYNTKDKWFATSMWQNKFGAIDIATHELMHFMFHKYYWDVCVSKGLSPKQIWDIKESFTVLLNLEFGDIRFKQDTGYPEHEKIRKAIQNSWIKYQDFDKALDAAIKASN